MTSIEVLQKGVCPSLVKEREDRFQQELLLWEKLYFFPAPTLTQSKAKGKSKKKTKHTAITFKADNNEEEGEGEETKYSSKLANTPKSAVVNVGKRPVETTSSSQDSSSEDEGHSSDMSISSVDSNTEEEVWKVDKVDSEVEQRNRYFVEDRRLCRLCNEPGHLSNSCTNLQKHLCTTCGEYGHLFPRCPFSACYRCGMAGHQSKDCTQNLRCNRCKSSGHISNKCPELWRQYHSTVTDDAPLVTNPGTNRSKNCHCCGSRGHFYYDCKRASYGWASPFPGFYGSAKEFNEQCRPSYNNYSHSDGENDRGKHGYQDKKTSSSSYRNFQGSRHSSDRQTIQPLPTSLLGRYPANLSGMMRDTQSFKPSGYQSRSAGSSPYRQEWKDHREDRYREDRNYHHGDFDRNRNYSHSRR